MKNKLLILIQLVYISSYCKEVVLDPAYLVCSERFDVMAKYIYGRHRAMGIEDGWPLEVYREHLRVWGNFHEGLPLPSFPHFDCAKEYIKKDSFKEFVTCFNRYLDSIRDNGFDSSKSVLPIDQNGIIMDGSHRLGAALVYSAPVICKVFSLNSNIYNSQYFKNKKNFVAEGLAAKYLDAMALEYVGLRKNTYVAILYPCAKGNLLDIKSILQKHGKIVYEKEIFICENGPLNLLHLAYENERWVGSHSDGFTGLQANILKYFPEKKGTIKVFLYECSELEKVKVAKAEVRNLFKIGNQVIHINDTYAETVKMSQALFVENSVHWLNKAKLKYFNKFEEYIKKYKQWIKDNDLPLDMLCVDSSAILSAYGLRDCNDLDFLSCPEHLVSQDPYIGNHEEEMKYHTFNKKEIIFNPQHYFYFRGLKFGSLQVIKAMKEKRNEPKDRVDVNLIKSVL